MNELTGHLESLQSTNTGVAHTALPQHYFHPVKAETYLQKWPTASQPASFICDDGKIYVVKCRHIGRGAYNDQIIARLGKLIGAPVGKPTIVDIPSDLVITNPDISALPPGLAHGVEFIADTSGRLNGIDLNGHLDNKLRFAKLAVLFGWLQGADVQFIYSTVEPKYVYSVDHGHFFPGGPPWTIASLQSATAPQLYAPIVSALSLTKSEMSSAVSAVTALTDQQISDCVSLVPPDWGVDAGEKVALTQYLIDRRGILPSLVLG